MNRPRGNWHDQATENFTVGQRAADRLRNGMGSADGRPRLHPVQLQAWGQRAGFVVDPDGTQLNLIENAA